MAGGGQSPCVAAAILDLRIKGEKEEEEKRETREAEKERWRETIAQHRIATKERKDMSDLEVWRHKTETERERQEEREGASYLR